MGSPQKNMSAQCSAPALGNTKIFYWKYPTAMKKQHLEAHSEAI